MKLLLVIKKRSNDPTRYNIELTTFVGHLTIIKGHLTSLKNVNTGENVSLPCISILPWYTNEAIYQIPSYNKNKKRGQMILPDIILS